MSFRHRRGAGRGEAAAVTSVQIERALVDGGGGEEVRQLLPAGDLVESPTSSGSTRRGQRRRDRSDPTTAQPRPPWDAVKRGGP